MTELETLRQQIDLLDRQLALTLKQRLDLVKKIADYKKRNRLPIRNTGREQQVIDNFTDLAGPDTQPVIRAIIDTSIKIENQ